MINFERNNTQVAHWVKPTPGTLRISGPVW